jgi:hypothetical protein
MLGGCYQDCADNTDKQSAYYASLSREEQEMHLDHGNDKLGLMAISFGAFLCILIYHYLGV